MPIFSGLRQLHSEEMSTSFSFLHRFGAGINLGNSLDAPDGETSWGNPPISRELIRFYRKEGFRSVRIPVTWSHHLIGDNGTIDPAFLARVREVVNWCLEEGFITIINLHHEDGWLSPNKENAAMPGFVRLWEQIARHFADCGEMLVFEAFNEIRNGDDWLGSEDACKAVSRFAERFVATVRAAGGYNANRYLMIPTYGASVGESACRSWVRVANDDRLIATVHCYAPHEFTHQSSGQKQYHPDWCRPALESVYDCLKRNFLDRGIPVVVGEAGVKQENGTPDEDGRIQWARDIANLSARNGIPLIVWEDGGGFQIVDRANVRWTHPELARAYANPYLWHDEFDGTAIDSSKWNFEIGTGNNGWGNDEKEFYTDRPENAYVKDGVLHVRAVKESCQGSDYTSARLVTKGKFSFTYGIVEARIALPTGRGIWPACGEIDIIEAINDEHVVDGTNHWDCDGRHAQHGRSTKDFYGAKLDIDITQFHTYKTVWSKDAISMYVDGFKYHEMTIKDNAGGTDAFHKPFFFVLNVAVGGNWPGFEIDNLQFPNEMRIEYIRVSALH